MGMTDKDKYEHLADEIESWLNEHESAIAEVQAEYRISNNVGEYSISDARRMNKILKGAVYHGHKGIDAVMQAKADLRFFRAGLQNY
jgi:hypothetical protein